LTLQAGFEIGPYRVLAPIGAGGMGEVYRARDTKLDRDVALKVLPPEVASAEALRRFEQEARAASSLNHPNIVAIYDVGRVDSIAYIAMELVEGQTLRGLMSAGPMPMKEALRVAGKVADVLASAHERGVTHRDLKPENVMIARDGYVKLLDFGLAKVRLNILSGDRTQPLTHTTAGHVFGTAAYMSPEQAAGRPVDFRSDQFSLGIILFEMVAARRPFDRETNAETLTAIIREDAPPLPNVSDAVSRDLQQIVSRCLAKSPHDRYASTRDLARDLRDLRNRITAGVDSTERSLRTFRMNAPRLPVIGIVAAVLLVLTGATMLVTRSRGLPPPSAPKSLAIVPFRDLSGSPDGQALSDGISEMIGARIAQARGLRVIAPFDGAPQKGDPLEIARRRGASLLLTGGVQPAGEGLRVSFQVQDAATGARVAGDMVTAQSADVFTLEDLVADSVLQALNVSRTHPVRVASALTGKDQRTYAEAIGLLQRITDEQSLDRAIHLLDSLFVNARDSAAVNGAYGKALLRKYSLTNERELVDQAAVYAERAVQLDASEPEAHVTLGELQRIKGNLPDAAASFQRALTLRPDLLDARLGLADTFGAMGRTNDADHLYRGALELRPDSPDVYGRYGKFCLTHGRTADAVRLFTKQTQVVPEAPRAWSNLGGALLNAGRYDDASKALQHSLAIEPTRGGFVNLGTCYFWLGRYADAAKAYEKAAALQPKQYVVWANLGDAYRWAPGQRAKSLEPYQTAIKLAREALVVNPNDVLARAIVASCLAKRGELSAAQMEIDIALRQDVTNARALYNAAVIASIRGDRAVARAWLQRAIAAGASPSDANRDPELSSINKPQA
jgi:serine/threonine protein kinase/tetratricopeptide (TPR) repeat protein